MVGNQGFHYGTDVSLPASTTKITVAIGKPRCASCRRRRPVRSHRGGEFRLAAVTVALLARWLHLASSVLLVGGAAMLLLAGRPTVPRPCAGRCESSGPGGCWC